MLLMLNHLSSPERGDSVAQSSMWLLTTKMPKRGRVTLAFILSKDRISKLTYFQKQKLLCIGFSRHRVSV